MFGLFKTISVLLTADSSSLRSQLLLASKDVDRFGHSVSGTASTASAASQAMAAAAKVGPVALAAGLAYSVHEAAEFEAKMRNVNSISHLSEAQFGALSKRVVDLSRELPQSAETLAAGLYDIASSGFQGAEGLRVLEESAKAASAGLTTTQNSAKAITAVLNAYGLGASEAADVSDTLFQTVNLGVVSFEELTGVIGDTVGTAAAAKVSMAQVGAAIATMTLSGISASEAGTSLNRVLQSIIDPSESLTTVLRQLGYESGAQALEADGLRGVMEKLRTATGGNVTALLELFTETRAQRGALALMSNEGQNYARVSAEIEDKNRRQGATAAALTEQMKSLKAQFGLFMNGVNAAAIEVGSRLLPALSDALDATRSLASDGFEQAQRAAQALEPFLRNVAQIGGDVADIAKAMVRELGPLAGAVAAVVAGGVIQSLNALSDVLASITGFLADHPQLVEAVAVAYGVRLVASLAQTATAFVRLQIERQIEGMSQLSTATFGVKDALAAIGTVGAVLGIVAIANSLANAKSNAEELADSLTKGLDLRFPEGFEQALKNVNAELTEMREKTGEGNRVGRFFTVVAELATPMENKLVDAAAAARELGVTQEELAAKTAHFSENMWTVANATGASAEQVKELARRLGVDLTGSFGESTDERQKLIDHFKEMAQVALGGGEDMSKAAAMPIDELEAMQKAVEDVKKKVGEAFAGATDVISSFKTGASLQDFYGSEIAKAEGFYNAILDATRRGLDPAIIKRLLEAGPEQAAPFLGAIAEDHSGRMIEIANRSEAALREINVRVVEAARLTQIAINSLDDSKVRDLGVAMQISAANFELGADATARSIADKINLPLQEVTRVADEFGITLSNLNGKQVSVDVAMNFYATGDVGGLGTKWGTGRAAGGLIPGPGRGDIVPAMLEPGEFVMRRSAVQHFGADAMYAMNRYAEGGMVSPVGPMSWSQSRDASRVGGSVIDYRALARALRSEFGGHRTVNMTVQDSHPLHIARELAWEMG